MPQQDDIDATRREEQDAMHQEPVSASAIHAVFPDFRNFLRRQTIDHNGHQIYTDGRWIMIEGVKTENLIEGSEQGGSSSEQVLEMVIDYLARIQAPGAGAPLQFLKGLQFKLENSDTVDYGGPMRHFTGVA